MTLKCPNNDFSPRHLTHDLLQPLPNERLQLSTRVGSALTKHAFFADIDWAALEELKSAPPFVPAPAPVTASPPAPAPTPQDVGQRKPPAAAKGSATRPNPNPNPNSNPSPKQPPAAATGSATRSFVDTTCEQFRGDQSLFAGF